MAVRSIATLSLSFGLVSIPVKVYAATESSAALRFKLLSRGGQRVRRQYVADASEAALVDEAQAAAPASAGASSSAGSFGRDDAAPASRARAAGERDGGGAATLSAVPSTAASPAGTGDPRAARSGRGRDVEAERERDEHEEEPVEPIPPGDDAVLRPSQIVKGYEFEKGRFVTFTESELKALASESRQTIDIVSFIPEGAVDPVYYDKAYYLAPDRKGEKPYSLLRAALRESGRAALAKWAWRAKEYVVQIRAVDRGLVLQQLLYADEVRPIETLDIGLVDVGAAELQLALRLIEQISDDAYHPEQFVDEEKARILAAVERKIAGRAVVAKAQQPMPSAQVIDLVAALRASLDAIAPKRTKRAAADVQAAAEPRERKPPRRAEKAAGGSDAATPPRARGRQSAR